MSDKQAPKYILIVEDHPSTANDLARSFQEISPDSKILQADTVNKAREYVRLYSHQIQLITIDLGLPEDENIPGNSNFTHGISFLRELLQDFPEMNLMILSTEPKKAVMLKDALLKHKGGLILESKQNTLFQLKIFAERVIQGEFDYRSIQEYLKDIGLNDECNNVLFLANQGYSNAYIADAIHLDIRTVSNRWSRIYAALEIYEINKEIDKKKDTDKDKDKDKKKFTFDKKLRSLYIAREKGVI